MLMISFSKAVLLNCKRLRDIDVRSAQLSSPKMCVLMCKDEIVFCREYLLTMRTFSHHPRENCVQKCIYSVCLLYSFKEYASVTEHHCICKDVNSIGKQRHNCQASQVKNFILRR